MSIENTIKEWLQYEPRKIRPPRHTFYPLTVDLVYNRIKTQLPSKFIKDKKVLDLGCCIPFNEPWCNQHGAKLYHGVEILKEIANKGAELVQAHNKIFHDSIENFINQTDLSFYDTIIAQSSLNAVANLPEILHKLFQSKATIIFESTDKTNDGLDPFISITNTSANFDSTGENIFDVQKWFPNLKSMNIFAEIDQYKLDDSPNKLMQLKIPEWRKHKFACWLVPNNDGKIYPHMKDYEWKFDKKVAKIFDTHAPKHIPDYEYVIDSIPNIIKKNVDHNDKILDVGCASGKTIKKLYYNGYTNLYGTDNSQDMLDICPKNLATYIKTDDIPKENFKCIIANWTLHFNKNKKELLEKIFNQLDNNGVCILSEKTLETPKDLYHKWKRAQGCSEQEILDKENSLKGVMHCDTADRYNDIFKQVGFDSILYNNKLGFYTWLLYKS
tara:strand:- start:108 stop:1433 length:1326 start_codon:yes stop_codon:yes gene_type:complete